MNLRVVFEPQALAEFQKLDKAVREFIVKKLEERASNPFVPKDALKGDLVGCFKIKINSSGHPVIYEVIDETLVVIGVGKRADQAAYKMILRRHFPE